MPKYFDLRGIPKILAVFAVSSLLTIAAGANLRFAGGIAGGALFLDASKNASSTARLQVDGNSGTFSASGTISSTAGSFETKAGIASIVCNGSNANCTIGQTNGTAGFLHLISGGDTELQTWSGSAFEPRLIIKGNQPYGEIGIRGSLFVSSTAASLVPAITSTGTLRIANQGGPTTTIDLTGRLCIKALDMVAGTQRYLTIASGSLVISTTDCR